MWQKEEMKGGGEKKRRGGHSGGLRSGIPVKVVRCSEALLSVSTMSLSAKASTDEVTSSHSIRVGFFKRALEGKKVRKKAGM
jgi:hypothetical protein